LSNAYDVVAARGGTDVAKRQEAHRMLDSADSPETLAEAIRVMQTEAQAAIRAGEKALRRPAGVTPQGPTPPPPSAVSPTGTPPPGPPAAGGGGPSAMDQQALAWANAHPNDPRAAAIKQRLGAR